MRRSIATGALCAGILVLPLAAQRSASARAAADPAPGAHSAADPSLPAHSSFPAAGEQMRYQVSLGVFGTVGQGSMEVVGTETLRGERTHRLRMDIEGKVLFASVDTRLESWVTADDFKALRYFRDQHEVNFDRTQTIDFFPAEMVWRASDGGTGRLGSAQPLDDVSFLYYARQLPLEVGSTYTLQRYWKEDGNPVVLKVVGKQRITVPAGTFNTIVVQPIIQTDGLFGEGGEARVYFTDDSRHVLVQIKSKVPIIGDLTLKLSGYTPGDRPVAPGG
jgi:hypothetical protein